MKRLITALDRKLYKDFPKEFPDCWACRCAELPLDLQRSVVDNAHIVTGAFRWMIRAAVCRLCRIHHMTQTQTVVSASGFVVPEVTLGHMYKFKKDNDLDFYDYDWLKSQKHKCNLDVILEQYGE